MTPKVLYFKSIVQLRKCKYVAIIVWLDPGITV